MFLFSHKHKLIFFKSLSFLLLRHFFNNFIKKFNPVFLFNLGHKGLGFRFFIHKNFLYILSGMSHYYKLVIPSSLFLVRRSKKIIFFCRNFFLLQSFVKTILGLGNFFVYKEKGILSNVVWSSFIKKKVALQS